jgi:hypothetical protein
MSPFFSLRPFPLEVLLLPGLVIFFASLLVSFAVTRRPDLAAAIATIKTSLFIIYYGAIFDGTYTFLDDWSYLEGGLALLEQGLFSSDLTASLDIATDIAGGQHYYYYIFNALCLAAFGNGYFAPVAMNNVLAICAAGIGTRLASEEFSSIRVNRNAFFAFLALHPVITAWSLVMNGKDTMVLLLHVVLLWSGAQLLRSTPSHKTLAIFVALSASLILFGLRFYVPLLFLVAYVAARVASGSALIVPAPLAVFAAFLLISALHLVAPDVFAYATDQIRSNFVNPAFGLLRILLTPIPFNTEAEYAFLNIPVLIHWMLLPLMVIGLLVVVRVDTRFSRFLLTYLGVFLLLYAAFGELQGPRHRLQLEYAIAVLQFVGGVVFMRTLRDRTLITNGRPSGKMPVNGRER